MVFGSACSSSARPKKFIADLRSDGTSLAWLQLDMNEAWATLPRELWTSPHTLDNAALKPRRVSTVPSSLPAASFKAIGGGFYAMVEQHDDQSLKKLHL